MNNRMFKASTPLLVIDCHGILHTLRYADTKRYYSSSRDWSLVGNFIRTVEALSYKFGAGDIVFAWDSPVSIRKERYSFYKEGRNKRPMTEQEQALFLWHKQQFAELRDKILPKIGFQNNIMLEGYEADDIIASIVNAHAGKRSVIFVSNDEDLYQLLGTSTMYIYTKRMLFGDAGFRQAYGIPPADWWRVKAIAGCKSDAVPGVKGIGEVYAIRYLQGKLVGTERHKRIEDAKELLDRNEWLVRLPLQNTPSINVVSDEVRSMDNFLEVLTKYNIGGIDAARLKSIAMRWRLK